MEVNFINKDKVMNNLNKLSDKDFIEIIRKSKNRINKIEKKEKQAIIPKRQRKFNNFDQKVISLYAQEMIVADIKAQLQKLYHGADISESVISQITDDVIDNVKAWQNRPLENIYPIVYRQDLII